MSSIRLKRITLVSYGVFAIELLLNGKDLVEFKFEVEEGPIDVVKSPSEFDSLIDRDFRRFAPLMNSILSLHRAFKNSIEIPDQQSF